jgi:hypothetical protein
MSAMSAMTRDDGDSIRRIAMPEDTKRNPDPSAKPTDAATEAYIYGYPLVLMDLTQQVMTNVPQASENAAPLNQLGNKRKFPEPADTAVVSPNADTLYSFAFLDLSHEPMLLSVPEMGKRYYLMQMLDAWTNVFASPGTRTTGSGQCEFAIVGPSSKGALPENAKVIKSPTSMVWIIGRTQTNGKEDYAAVHALQDQYKLTPLNALGKPPAPAGSPPVDPKVDMKTPPVEQVARLDANAFFSRLNALMKNNPPAAADAAALKRFAPLGIAPGKPFDLKAFDPAVAKSLQDAVRNGLAKIVAEAKEGHGQILNGWEFMTDVGSYGTDYLWRAVVAQIGLGANLPGDAVYPRATKDASGQPLSGANQYVIKFPKGQLPPVRAFWSITLYNSKQFFVPNPIHRYAIGDRDKLKFDDDGSLTIYVQHQSPGKDKESNWLPAPKDGFSLFMRLYWPKKEILESKWNPPEIERVAGEAELVA